MDKYRRVTDIKCINLETMPYELVDIENFNDSIIMLEDVLNEKFVMINLEWQSDKWLLNYNHVYKVISNAIETCLERLNKSFTIFKLQYKHISNNVHQIIFHNYYQSIRFYFSAHLLPLFEKFNCQTYNNDFYMIDTTLKEYTSANILIKYPKCECIVEFDGKKLLRFNIRSEDFRKQIDYTLNKKEVIYIKYGCKINIYVRINGIPELYLIDNDDFIILSNEL